MNRSLSRVLLASTLWLPACSFLEPRADPTRFVVLAAVDEMPGAVSSAPAEKRARVGLGPIVLPEYLQRLEVVTREHGTQIVPSVNDRWGEPLQRGVERVLAIDLQRALGASVVLYPWYATEKPDVQVQIAFTRFELEAPRSVVVRARWSIRDLTKDAAPIEHESSFTRAAPSDGAPGAATALSESLADLCNEIAAAWPH